MRRLPGRAIFLLDGLGAILSAFGLGVLAYHEDLFGMPKNDLYLLLVVAMLLSAYSLSRFYLNPPKWQTDLKRLAVVNVMYCGLTLFFVSQYPKQLSSLGYAYFAVELTVIVALALVELNAATRRQ